MKKQLTFLLLLLNFGLNAQIFRSIKIVEPRQVVRSTLDTTKFAVLVKRDYLIGNDQYYYVTADENGELDGRLFRYGSAFLSAENVVIPTNFLAAVVKPSCNNGDNPFQVNFVRVLSASAVEFQFDAANLTQFTATINGANAPPYVYSTIVYPTTNTITINPSPSLPEGNYTISLAGTSCSGAASKTFSTTTTIAPPTVSSTVAAVNGSITVGLSTAGSVKVYKNGAVLETLTGKLAGSFSYTFTSAGTYAFSSVSSSGVESIKSSVVIVDTPTTTPTEAFAIPPFEQGVSRYYTRNEWPNAGLKYIKLQVTKIGDRYRLTDDAVDSFVEPAGNQTDSFVSGGSYQSGNAVRHNGSWYIVKFNGVVPTYIDPATGNPVEIVPGTNNAVWEPAPLNKRYYYGVAGERGSNYWTRDQMRSGIDIEDFRGEYLLVQAAITVGNSRIQDWGEQYIYTPASKPAIESVVEGGKTTIYYNRPASKTFSQTDYDARFNDYLSPADFDPPAGHYIASDLANGNERASGTTFQNLGIHGKWATDANYTYMHGSEAWIISPAGLNVKDVPGAWTAKWAQLREGRTYEEARDFVFNTIFKPIVIDTYADKHYVFLNNELNYNIYESPEFTSTLAYCYSRWSDFNDGILVAWNSSVFDISQGIPSSTDKAKAWSEYNATDFAALEAMPGKYVTVYGPGRPEYVLGASNTGEYPLGATRSFSIYKLVTESVFGKKFYPSQKVIGTVWRTVEPAPGLTRFGAGIVDYRGDPVYANIKASVHPNYLDSYAALAAMTGDGLHPWDDGFSVERNVAGNFYPNFSDVTIGGVTYFGQKAYYLYDDFAIREEAQLPNQTNSELPVHTPTPTINSDGSFDGLWRIYQNKDLLAGELKFADINDGSGWRTGADKFVIGAYADMKPFCVYRVVGNEALVVIYDGYATATKNVTVRIETGSGTFERVVRVSPFKATVARLQNLF